MTKKNKTRIPRRKRMSRKDRLQSGMTWLEKYDGKNAIKGYSNWYGVNNLCAIIELRALGVSISKKRENQIKLTAENKVKSRAETKKKNEENLSQKLCADSDDNFFYIVGYTSGGAPYGVTWEDVRKNSPWEMEEQ